MFLTPRLKVSLSLILSCSMTALAAQPTVGFVELQNYLHGRDKALFRKSDDNKEVLLPKGTRGLIKAVKNFSSGNQGLCIETLNVENYKTSGRENDCIWVYYTKGKGDVKIFEKSSQEGMSLLTEWVSGKKVQAKILRETQSPERAVAAETQAEVSAIPGVAADGDRIVAPTATPQTAPPASPATPATDVTAQLEGKIETVASLNRGEQYRTQDRSCVDCPQPVVKYESCKANNSYFETLLEKQQLSDSFMGNMIRSNPPTLIRPACVHEALTKTPPKMVVCSSGSVAGKRGSPSPCLSQNYERLISNSINTVSHCSKGFLVSNPALQDQTVLSIFNMMSWESSLHPHAVSSGNAGGMGQLTYYAIEDVNRTQLDNLRAHLQNHPDPLCKNLGASALAQKNNHPPMRSNLGNSCDRINMNEGSTNPATNLLYSMAYQKITRDNVIRNFFGRHSPYARVFAEMKESDRNWLIDQLAAWSHNTGPAGLKTSLEALLDCHSNVREAHECTGPITKATDPVVILEKLKTALLVKPHWRNILNKRQNSLYYSLLSERGEDVRQQAGGISCLVN